MSFQLWISCCGDGRDRRHSLRVNKPCTSLLLLFTPLLFLEPWIAHHNIEN